MCSLQVVFCPNWPHLSVPVSNCVHLVDCVTRLAAAHPDKPTLVMDSFGATEAAIFTVLASLVRMLDTEDWVDVFYWFKCVHLARYKNSGQMILFLNSKRKQRRKKDE